jgi:hypothetical protein
MSEAPRGPKPFEPVVVRVGTPDDLDAMMQIAMMACEENGFVQPNPIKLLQAIYPALHQDGGIVGIVGEPGEQIEGAVLLMVGQNWYSDAPLLEERAIFIHPAFRRARGGRAARLCEFSKKVADQLGMTLTIGVLSDHRTSQKLKMYERVMGKPPSGAYWLYGGETGQPIAGE